MKWLSLLAFAMLSSSAWAVRVFDCVPDMGTQQVRGEVQAVVTVDETEITFRSLDSSHHHVVKNARFAPVTRSIYVQTTDLFPLKGDAYTGPGDLLYGNSGTLAIDIWVTKTSGERWGTYGCRLR